METLIIIIVLRHSHTTTTTTAATATTTTAERTVYSHLKSVASLEINIYEIAFTRI